MVDPEITFQTKRISLSSDEPIDTSDELLDVDNFIADCAREGQHQRVGEVICQNDERNKKKRQEQGD